MKTLKALKNATIWNCVFCFSWVLSTACLVIDEYYDIRFIFSFGIIFIYGWMVNPFPIISCFRCLKVYLTERKIPINKQLIGRKWVWIFIFLFVTTVLWILGVGLFVKFTGGV